MELNIKAQAMEKRFLEALEPLLSVQERVLAAVSGGADSVCMLYLFLAAGVRPHVVHIHHMLRGAEADRDAQFVRSLALKLGLECEVLYKDVPALVEREGLSFEEAARALRYEGLFECAERLGIAKIAVAHNLNDQAETVLMRLARGSALTGLGGMRERREDGVIRPLLEFSRAEIEEYCFIRNIEYIQDSTNFSEDYSRNYIRRSVIPALERLNPSLCRTLAANARLMGRDEAFLSRLAAEEYKRASRRDGEVFLEADRLKAMDRALSARVVRMAVAEVCGLRDVTSGHIERVLDLLTAPTGKELPLKRGARAQRSYEWLIIGVPRVNGEFLFSFALGEFASDGINITVSRAAEFIKRGKNEEYIDLAKVPDGAVLRNRRPGDRIFPLGAPGEKKLKDYFIDKKVPRKERERLVLLASGERVLAVIGMTVSAEIAVSDKTKEIAVIKVEDNYAGKGY